MRVVTKTTLIAVIIVVACAVILAINARHKTQDTRHKNQDANSNLEFRISKFPPEVDWPMFRGEQRLLGIAQDVLPDKINIVWKFKTNGKIKSSPVIKDGLVFIGSTDANIYAIDLADGHQVWAYQTGNAVEATPCVVEGAVFIGSSDHFLYAIDAKAGKLLWKYETDGRILGAANWTRPPEQSKTGSVWILVGSYDNKLHCVDSSSGKAMWTCETQNYINGTPAVGDGETVFGGCDAMIHVISLADGNKITEIDTGSFIAASPAFFQGRVYVGNYNGVFVCADISKKEIIWKYTAGDSPIFSSPAVDENPPGRIIFGSRDKRIHCLRLKDGAPIWELMTLGEVDSSPVICRDKVVVGSEDGRLYMINLSDGNLVWSYEIGQPITSSPAVANGMLVVGCDDGFIYAFKGEYRNQQSGVRVLNSVSCILSPVF